MNDEIKRLLSRFLFISVLICCLGLLASGSITASQNSEKNAFDKAYAVVNIKSTGNSLEINMGEDKYELDINIKDKIKRYEDYILLTPLASVYFFGKSLEKFTVEFR